MSTTDKEQWRKICQQDKGMHIFMRDWWLDAVCGTVNWDCIIEYAETSCGMGYCALPFYKMKSHGFNIITQPVLTQKIGPYVNLPEGLSEQEAIDISNQLLGAALDRIPEDIASISFNVDWHITDGETFLERGYGLSTRYTTVILDLSDLDAVWNNLSSRARKEIRKAEQCLYFKESNDVNEFSIINEMTFSRQNLERPYQDELLRKIDKACQVQQARKIFFAVDDEEQVHGGVYVVYDENVAYFLMSGENAALRKRNAGRFMKWNAIKVMSQLTKAMDFEGSMIEGGEKSFRKFGAKQYPYSKIYKTYNKSLCALLHLKAILGLLKG